MDIWGLSARYQISLQNHRRTHFSERDHSNHQSGHLVFSVGCLAVWARAHNAMFCSPELIA